MKPTTTHILTAIVGVLALTCLWSIAHTQNAKDAALASARDVQIVEQETQQLRQAGVVAARGNSPSNEPAEDLTGRIRRSALTAGISDELLSIETSQSPRGEQGRPGDTSMFMRFSGITIGQLVNFANAAADPSIGTRVSSIDLSTPDGAAAGSPETWSTQLTLTTRTDATGPTR